MAEDFNGPVCLRYFYGSPHIRVEFGQPASFEVKNLMSGSVLWLYGWEIHWGDGTADSVYPRPHWRLHTGDSRTISHTYTQSGLYGGTFSWLGAFLVGPNEWAIRPDGSPGECSHELVTFTVEVAKKPAPKPPIAHAGIPETFILEHETRAITQDMLLDGSKSTSHQGTPSYTWRQLTGPKQLLPQTSGQIVRVAAAGNTSVAPGDYGFQLSVTDAVGTSTAQVLHTVIHDNTEPIAVAPPPQIHNLGAGYRLQEDVILDGSKSYDRDGDPLTYQWGIQSSPCRDLPWAIPAVHSVNNKVLSVLPKSTTVPPKCLGEHKFFLTVFDKWRGSSAFTYCEFRIIGTKVTISPMAPSAVELQDLLAHGVDIPIDVTSPLGGVQADEFRLRVENGLTGALLHEHVERTYAGQPSTIRWFGRITGDIPVSSGRYALRVVPYTEGLPLPHQEKPHYLDIVEFRFRFEDWTVLDDITTIAIPRLQRAWTFDIDPGPLLRFINPIGPLVKRALGRVDSVVSHARTMTISFTRRRIPVLANLLQTQASDLGLSLGRWGVGYYPQGARRSRLRILPAASATEDQMASSSQAATLSPDHVYVIEPYGPTPPRMKVGVQILGPPSHAIKGTIIGMRLAVSDVRNDGAEVLKHPVEGWESLAATDQWKVELSKIRGGSVIAEAQLQHLGRELLGTSRQEIVVWGKNPTRAQARRSIEEQLVQEIAEEEIGWFGSGLDSTGRVERLTIRPFTAQAVAFIESGFQQFDPVLIPATMPGTKSGVGPPLERHPEHYGMGQLPTVIPEELWNWQEHIRVLCARLVTCRRQAITYFHQVRSGDQWDPDTGGTPPNEGVSYPNCPEFTQDQLDLEMWARYHSGLRYHDYDNGSRRWVPRTPSPSISGMIYAEGLRLICDGVISGEPPYGWLDEDESGFSEAEAQRTQQEVIRTSLGTAPSINPILLRDQLALLRWSELFLTLFDLGRLPVGASDSYLEQLYAALPHLDASTSLAAAIRAAVLAEGNRIIDTTKTKELETLTALMRALSGADQLRVLQRLGVNGQAAEGFVAIAQSEIHQPGTNESGDTLAGVPFGDWSKPPNQPYPFYIGNAAHEAIALFYRGFHNRPDEEVWTNYSSSSVIAKTLAARYQFDPARAEVALRLKPDIFEFSPTAHPLVAPGIVYEIKPSTLRDVALQEAAGYGGVLIELGVPTVLGPTYMSGTSGVVAAPNGWYRFNCLVNGVIEYSYVRAPESAIRARDEARGRTAEKLPYQDALIAAGVAVGLVLLTSALAAALVAAGFLLVLA